jgi:membrane associated rhomboid family serine protease
MAVVDLTTRPKDPRRRSDDRLRGVALVGVMAALMWILEIVDRIPGVYLDGGGIRPHSTGGLDGILFAPFLHADFAHLISNTIPFLVLGGIIGLSGLARTILVTAIVAVVGGLGVWLLASSGTNHIGASGIVFGYAAYLVTRGAFTRRALHFAAGAVVAAVWGTTLLAGLAPRDGISWQGHLFGAVGGIVAARLLDRRAPDLG